MSLKTPIQRIGDGINDSVLHFGRNGAVPAGAVQRLIAQHIQYRQHQGRPLGHFWGGWDTNAIASGTPTFRLARLDLLDGGCAKFGALMHVMSSAGDLSDTAGIYINGSYTPVLGNVNAIKYPDQIQSKNATTPERSPAVATGDTIEEAIGFDDTYPMAGCFYEDAVTAFADVSTTLATDGVGPGKDILASQTGAYGTVEVMIDRFMHVWKNRRNTYSWFTTESGYHEFALSSHAYRYIFDQTVGTGGTAPSATGPAITLPHQYSGPGRDTGVRVFVWVLAAMSGTTDGGTLAVANKDPSSGLLGAMTPLVNPQTIGGTGFAWYPSLGTFDPTETPYFVSPTNLPFDRVCLGGRSEGTTDKLRIRGFMMAAYPDRS